MEDNQYVINAEKLRQIFRIEEEGRSSNPFKKLESVKPRLRVMIHGGAGSGKSFWAARGEGVFFVDVEGSTPLMAKNPDVKIVGVTIPDSTNSALNAIHWIWKSLQKPDSPVKTLVIDSITELWTMFSNSMFAQAGIESPTFGDWRPVKKAWKMLLMILKRLPCNLVLIARDKEGENKLTGNVPPWKASASKNEKNLIMIPDVESSVLFEIDYVLKAARSSDENGKIIHNIIVEKERSYGKGIAVNQVLLNEGLGAFIEFLTSVEAM